MEAGLYLTVSEIRFSCNLAPFVQSKEHTCKVPLRLKTISILSEKLHIIQNNLHLHLSLVMRKPDFCICENKDADQLHGYHEADQRLCFHYTNSTIPLLPKSEISSI